jgi:DNA-binding transcriptional ArsR family regulator
MQVITCLLSVVVTDIFQAIAAPARRAILDELVARDGQTLFELCTRLTMSREMGLSRQAISQHIDVLEEAGLVRSERQGRYKFHYVDTTPLQEMVERWPDRESKDQTR